MSYKQVGNKKAPKLSDELRMKYTKGQLISSIAATALVFFTIALILIENYNKSKRYYSLMGLSVTFIALAVSNFYNHKLTGNRAKYVIGIIYVILAIAVGSMTLFGKVNI